MEEPKIQELGPNETLNHDIRLITRKIDSSIRNIQMAASSGVSNINQFDSGRMASYRHDILDSFAQADSDPELDITKSHPEVFTLKPAPKFIELTNDDMEQATVLYLILRYEMINSESSRLAAKFEKHDSDALLPILTKIEGYEYTGQGEHRPETNPSAPMPSTGKLGIR